jgi:peptide chain release factor 1
MIDKLEGLKRRFEEVQDSLSLPDVVSDVKKFTKLNKEYKDLGIIVEKFDEYMLLINNLKNAKVLIAQEKDPEFREMIKMEIEELQPIIETTEAELKILLVPKDPMDDKNVILEIRAGAGGDESALFAGDLIRMYQRYCEKNSLTFTLTDAVEGTAGGYSKIVASITGEDAYGRLKYESGVHRVQRVPATESQGRIHTSAASIAVLPEAEEFDFVLNMSDIRKDTFRASGAGGQHINKTESAVRLTHFPSGVVVECQDGRSQHQNYDSALTELRSRLYQAEMNKQQAEVSAHRKSLIGSGDRSDKIRTYNWPQGRVTDHRINKTVYNLENIINGDVGDFIEALRIADNAEKMLEEEE